MIKSIVQLGKINSKDILVEAISKIEFLIPGKEPFREKPEHTRQYVRILIEKATQHGSKKAFLSWLLVLFCVSPHLSGCTAHTSFSQLSSNTPFVPMPSAPTPPPQPINPTPNSTPTPDSSNSAGKVIKTIKPVLAVRALGCLMCHANISANVITDFGYEFGVDANGHSKGPVYFGGGPLSDNSSNFSGYYSAYANSWQTANILGTVYVPNTIVPKSYLTHLKTPGSSNQCFPDSSQDPTLATVMQTDFDTSATNNGNWLNQFGLSGDSNGISGPRGSKSMSIGITPNDSVESRKVVSLDSITIQAPTSSDILSLVPAQTPTPVASPGIFEIKPSASSASTLQGLLIQNYQLVANDFSTDIPTIANTEKYVMNDQSSPAAEMHCYGDVVINGALYLKNLNLRTDENGCRLYVNGTVFLEGPLKFFGSLGKENLQITSSVGIYMGMAKDSLHERLAHNENTWIRGAQWTFPAPAPNPQFPSQSHDLWQMDQVKTAWRDAYKVGIPARQPTQPQWNTQSNSPLWTAVTQPYSHLLLNAPIIQSKYAGDFQGVIIAEIVMFRLSKFSFIYDPAFETAPALPLLKKEILVAQ